jgi:F-type H+-transporting ATPase subunit epsilon
MLDVIVISPEKVIFEGRARSVIFPGEQGVFEILPFHKPLLSRLVSGTLIIDGLAFAIRRGIVGLNHNKATVIVEE